MTTNNFRMGERRGEGEQQVLLLCWTSFCDIFPFPSFVTFSTKEFNPICWFAPITSQTRLDFCHENEEMLHFLSRVNPAECVMDLDYQSEMIIFESILTTFELSIIFWGSFGIIENRLETKTKQPCAIIACPNLWNALYQLFFLH